MKWSIFDIIMMRNFRLFILVSFVSLFWACTDSTEKLSQPNIPNIPEDYGYTENDLQHLGMVKVHAAGHSVLLGTNDSLSTSREHPQMRVEFSYDYSIGAHEVTHAEFAEVMGGAADETNRFLPIRNVTYYDAILMANRKSIMEGFDTVYTYSKKNHNNIGNCINMADLVFHPEVEGYRLPTEAEWVYAASLDFVPENSWNGGNSGYDLHDYCTKGVRSSGLCDMEGNAKEWVNDWLGFFRDTTVENYVGAPDGGSLGERVLKGGSYRDDIANINLYSRGDIYTVTSSTLALYVGFRLAFGSIPNPVWLSENGVATSSRVFPSATSMNVRTKTGTFHSKLAFRNENTGNLAFIDYMNGTLSVLEIPDTIDSYHPDISPDGSKVAFCTMPEGVSGKSSLYVRDLKAVDSKVVRLNVESAAIPRWNVTAAGDTVIVYVTDCGVNDDESTWKAQSTWQVKFAGGKFGKPEKLFDGTYNGGVSDDRKFAVSGARLLRARMSDKDSLWYGGKQACNASLSKDGTKRTVFLDFGENSEENFVGEKYNAHEYILVADSTGQLVQSVKAPEGFTFDHVEWVSSTNLIVGTLVSLSGNHAKVSLTDLGDGSTMILAESDDLWHPCLWVNPELSKNGTGSVNIDSAGMYYSDRLPYYSVELRVKMENFWTRRDSVTAVAMGSSRMLFGLSEKSITSVNMLNMAYSSGDLYGAEYLLKNYMFNHLPHFKYLVLEISPDMFWRSADESWNPVLENAVGYAYDANHGFWVDSIPDGFLEAVKDAPKPISVLMHPYDFENFLLPSTSWYIPDVAADTVAMKLSDAIVDVNMKVFASIVDMCKKHGVTVVALVIPRHAGYKDTGAFGVYGPSRSVARDLFDILQKYDVVWMDENNWGDHDYQDESMGYNMDHLSYIGAFKMSERVDSKLSGL
jgi:Uncharacterized conserved protein